MSFDFIVSLNFWKIQWQIWNHEYSIEIMTSKDDIRALRFHNMHIFLHARVSSLNTVVGEVTVTPLQSYITSY